MVLKIIFKVQLKVFDARSSLFTICLLPPLGGCGYSAVYGGNAENNVEFLLTSVFDKVDEYLGIYFNTKLTGERDGTNIIGFSDGGLFSCYAAWTRPKVSGAKSECQNESVNMLSYLRVAMVC